MQQYLVLCAGVDHEEEINPSLLDFRSVRQQLEDGAFVFPACDFLRDKLGSGADSKPGAPTVTPSGSTSRTNRRAPPVDEVINSQKDLFPKDPTDNWQVYLDHVRTKVPRELLLEGLARRAYDRTDSQHQGVDQTVPSPHAPTDPRRRTRKETKIRDI
jgi:hypothetical protein